MRSASCILLFTHLTIIEREGKVNLKYYKAFALSKLALLLFYFITIDLFAQTEVIRAIQYKQITNFEQNHNISSIKMSDDGTKIVFSSSGEFVKVFTINVDGTGIVEVYDFQRNGSGVFVDISSNGEKIIWCDGKGEIFTANADGSGRVELATLLPNPNPDFGDIEPDIPIPPRLSSDGSQVLFIHRDRNPDASGIWRVNSDNTGLVQVFSFTLLWYQGIGRTDNIVEWSGLSGGFDISADGSKMIFGTNVLKLAEHDYENGDAFVFDGEEFYHLGDYRIGEGALASDDEGNNFMFFREVADPITGSAEIILYSTASPYTSPLKLIEGITWPGFPHALQMSSSGDKAVALAGGALPYNLPLSIVDRITQSHFDVVNCDDVSIALNGFRMSYSHHPSINYNGEIICYLSDTQISQIWIANIESDAVATQPAITGVSLNPPYITHDRSITSTFKAHVFSPGKDIQAVYLNTLKEGKFFFRAITTDFPFMVLFDDGTHGDENGMDHTYTNNSVRRDLDETPLGSFTIRISATDGQYITAVDAEPFEILEEDPTGVNDNYVGKNIFYLEQNYPNPFNPVTSIKYQVSRTAKVSLKVYDVLGREIETLIDEAMYPGVYKVEFNGTNLPSGLYFYKLTAGDFAQSRKMAMIK